MSKSLVATLTSLRTDLDLAMLEIQALKNKKVPVKKDEDISGKIEAIVTEEFVNNLYRTK